MMSLRIMLLSLGIISAVALSPWVTAVCIVVLSVRYRALEAILLGALLDTLWLPTEALSLYIPICTISACILVLGFTQLRSAFIR
jgi:hypothetical protein